MYTEIHLHLTKCHLYGSLQTFKPFKWLAARLVIHYGSIMAMGHFNELDISFILCVTYSMCEMREWPVRLCGSLILILCCRKCHEASAYCHICFPSSINLPRLDVRLKTNHNNGNNYIEIERNYILNHGKFVIFVGLHHALRLAMNLSNHQSVMQSNFQLFSKLSMFVIGNKLQNPPWISSCYEILR